MSLPVPTVPACWTFPSTPAAVPHARRAVTRALPAGCHPQLRDDLRLLTSELVTNAIRHNPDPAGDHLVELVLWRADGHYWIAVSDAGTTTLPALLPSPAAPDATCGRGLPLIDAIAATWAVVPRPTAPHGKSVVAGIRLHSPDS